MPRSTDLRNFNASQFSPPGVGDKVRGGALATQSSRDAALYTQVRCVPHGRRIVCRAGIQGQVSNLVVDGVNPNGGGQNYPSASAERVMARTRVKLTPGYALSATGVFLPNGPAQQPDGLGGYKEGPGGGAVRVDVSLDNGGGTSAASYTFVPETSKEQYKGLGSGAGKAWEGLRTLSKEFILASAQQVLAAGWTEGVVATITITARGGARPVDVVVYERPWVAVHDETHREGTVSDFPAAGAQSEYPLTAVAQGTNPTKGSQQANKSTADQRGVWGPVLFSWTCWNEDVATIVQTEGTAVAVTQTSFRDLQSTAITTYGSGNPGWSVASGAYGMTLEQSGLLELRDVNGCIPVIVRAYARMLNAAHVGTIRFQTADYSYRDLTITGSTSFGWYSGLAWLRVPVHASLDSLLQVFTKVALAGQTLEIRALCAEFGGHYAVTQ